MAKTVTGMVYFVLALFMFGFGISYAIQAWQMTHPEKVVEKEYHWINPELALTDEQVIKLIVQDRKREIAAGSGYVKIDHLDGDMQSWFMPEVMTYKEFEQYVKDTETNSCTDTQ